VLPAPLEHLFLGRDIGPDAAARAVLERWSPLVSVTPVADPCAAAARLLAEGQVLGWVQGRSEFGPRALGNRSIVADPRPAANMTRINAMIKKREGYRPFAPSVLEQHAAEYFEVPPHAPALPYMTCVVPVSEDKRALLGAVTHIDGSARVQTVNRAQNERYYRLIEEFGRLTGVPVVLNTSFNNNAEPVVDSIDEAVACYLTTGLDTLVVGNCLVSRARADAPAWEGMAAWLPETVAIRDVEASTGKGRRERFAELVVRSSQGRRRRIGEAARAFLLQAGADRCIGGVADAVGIAPEGRAALLEELRELWAARLVSIGPLRPGA
jgi:carbamoyltransferase